MKEPKYIQWPEEGEFAIGQSVDHRGRCCLGGWARVSFFGNPRYYGVQHEHKAAYGLFIDMLNRVAYQRGFEAGFIAMNDDHRVSDKTRAAVWAEAARARGYEKEE